MQQFERKLPNELVELLCNQCGFILSRCEEDWGGTYAWSVEDKKGRICGYKTEEAARTGFILDSLGNNKVGAVMLDLLLQYYRPSSRKS